jgi:cobalt-zinc-cadmium efflux system outer membrane protein
MWVAFGVIAAAASLSGGAESVGPAYTIEQLEGIARSVHPTLAAVEAGVERAAGTLRQAQAYPNPALVLAVGRGRPRDGGDSREERRIGIVQPIELPGVRKWRARVAELGARGAEVERAVVELMIDATVTRLAYSIVGEQQRVEIARESARNAGRLHDLLERRAELGESSPLEAVKARAEWFSRRRDVIDAEGALRVARAALDLFCGGRLASEYEVTEPLFEADPAELPADLDRRLLASNPVLRRARVSVERAEAQIESRKKATLPRIDLIVGHDTEIDRTAASLGVGLTIPLWNRNRGAVAAAAADRRRTAADAEVLAVGLGTDLAGARTRYARARAAILLHREGWTEAAAHALRIATFSFENGEASLLDVLDAQRANLEVRLAEADAWIALHTARAEIERLIGGRLGSGGDE